MQRVFLKLGFVVGTIFTTCLCSQSAQAATVTGSNSIDGYVDNSGLTRFITFDAADFSSHGSTISDLNVSVFFAKSNIDFDISEETPLMAGTPFFDEIQFTLTSPEGTSVALINNATTGGEASFNQGIDEGFRGILTFDQSAENPVNVNLDVITAGVFRPASNAGNLNSFLGENAIGTWTLFVEDDATADGLSFYRYDLEVSTSSTAVPTPALLPGLLSMGLAALKKRTEEQN